MSDEKSGDGRRKRRGGLRVPSDNVPRQPHSESSDSIPVPVPEPIGLAASISESFGVASTPIGNGSNNDAAVDMDELPTIVSEGKPEAVLVGNSPVAQASEYVDPVTEDEDNVATMVAGDTVAVTLDTGEDMPVPDSMPTEKVRASDIHRESIGESIDIPFDDSEVTLNTTIPGPMPGPDLTSPSSIPSIKSRQDTVADDAAAVANSEKNSRESIVSTPSPTVSAPTEKPPQPKGGIVATPVVAATSPDKATGKSNKKNKKPRFARALTMALNESDLEEVRNNVDEIRAQQAAAKSPESQVVAPGLTEPKVAPSPALASSPNPTPSPVVTAMPGATVETVVGESSDAVIVHASSDRDSGDVLADEELEEVSETSMRPKESDKGESGSIPEQGGPTPPPPETASSPDKKLPPKPPANAGAMRVPGESDATTAKPKEEPPPPPPASAKAKVPPPISNLATPPKPPGESKKRRAKGWYDDIFDEDYLRTLPFLTPQATQFEANFVMESLGVDAGAQILDVGCGYGRHAMELAARGYHLVGLDNSLPLLLRGADEAQRRGLTINFIHGDMREMTFESQFDGAYCLFSSFGYFDDETNKQTAQNIAKALKPGARFVVEVLNRDYLVADLPSRIWWEGEGCVVLEEVEFNYFSSRIVSNRSVVFDDGRQLEQEISLRSFSLHELGKFLHSVGFRVLEISGSMSTRGRFFGAHSRDIVVVAERRGD